MSSADCSRRCRSSAISPRDRWTPSPRPARCCRPTSSSLPTSAPACPPYPSIPRSVLITNANFTKAEPQAEAIAAAAREIVLPHLRASRVPVIGRIRGRDSRRRHHHPGAWRIRLFGVAHGRRTGAAAIEIWTDVDGMLTADPRVVPDAQLIERIGSMRPRSWLRSGPRSSTPARLRPPCDSGYPCSCTIRTIPMASARGSPSTPLGGRSPPSRVRARPHWSRSDRRACCSSPAFCGGCSGLFERHRTSVNVVATSEVSVSVTVDGTDYLDAILVDLAALGHVSVERARGVVAVVGAGLADNAAAGSRPLRHSRDGSPNAVLERHRHQPDLHRRRRSGRPGDAEPARGVLRQ